MAKIELKEDEDLTNLAPELSEGDRERLMPIHPVKEREYLLPTPMMQSAYSIVRNRVMARRTGLVFFGSPRVGKTRCATAAKEYLGEEFPTVHITLASARKASRASDAHMLRLILEGEHHVLAGRANSDLLFNNALADIEIKTKAKGGNQFVLLIDEMHLLNGTDLQQLVCFHNALELKKIKMTTISFAQPEIQHRRTALMAAKEHQIIARFLSELVPYSGCVDCRSLKRILSSFDDGSEFPDQSGWSFTRFFVPVAFHHGFRLAHYAEILWEHLTSARGVGEGSLPMEHTCLTIENLLEDLSRQDCSKLVVSNENVASAVASSRLRDFTESMA